MGISNTIILVVAVLFLIGFLIYVKKKGYNGMHIGDPEPGVSKLIMDDFEVINDNKEVLNNFKVEDVDENDNKDDESIKDS